MMDASIYEQTCASEHTDRRTTNKVRTGAPINFKPLNHEILRLALLGWKSKDIATHLGISAVTVSNTLNSPKGRVLMAQLQEERNSGAIDVAETMKQFAPRALEVVMECIDDPDGIVPMPVRAREAREFLGICGYVKPTRIQSSSVHTHLTLEEIEQLKAQARARAQASGTIATVADVECEPVHKANEMVRLIESEVTTESSESLE